MDTTSYFRLRVLVAHAEANNSEWIERVLGEPIEIQHQANGRIRYWGYITEAGKYLRVVTLEDGVTVHNAFFDRNYAKRKERP